MGLRGWGGYFALLSLSLVSDSLKTPYVHVDGFNLRSDIEASRLSFSPRPSSVYVYIPSASIYTHTGVFSGNR